MVAISFLQNDEPSGPNIDLEKKLHVEKRDMGLSDYNGDVRKGGRGGGGMSYRPPVSKEAAAGDTGSYYDKVIPLPPNKSLPFMSRPDGILSSLTILYFLLWFFLVFLVRPVSPCLDLFHPLFITTQIGLPLACHSDRPCL